MHEMALTESIVEIAVEAAKNQGADKVTRVFVEIGELSCVEPEALQFCFAAVAAGTLAEGASLEIERIAGAGWCADCEKLGAARRALWPLPRLRRPVGANDRRRRIESSRNGNRLMCGVCGCGQAEVVIEKTDRAQVHASDQRELATTTATGRGRIAIRILFIITIMTPPALIRRATTSTLTPRMRLA